MRTPIPSQAGTTAAAVPTTAPRLLLLEDIHKHTLNSLLDGGLAPPAPEAVPHGQFGQFMNTGFPSLACPSNLSCSSHRAKSFPLAPSVDPSCPAAVGLKDPSLALCTARNVTHHAQKTLKPLLTRASRGTQVRGVYLQK